jgi:hypothetical protein
MKDVSGPSDRDEQSTTRPRRREENLVVTEFENEVVVYDQRTHKVNCLSRTSAFVWTHCDGQTTVPQLAAQLREAVDPNLDEGVVWLALRQLDEANLLAERVSLPANGTRYTRRHMLKTGAAVAGGAVLLPVITNIVAPTRAHAATFVLNCGVGCTSDADCNVPGAICPTCDGTTQVCVG